MVFFLNLCHQNLNMKGINCVYLLTLFMPITASPVNDIRFAEEDAPFDATFDARKCAKGSTYCESIDNYPDAYDLKSILKETSDKYEALFGSDTAPPISIGNRFDGLEEEEQLCSSQVRVVFPQAALTQDNTWRYIINHSNYTQGVRVEGCIHRKRCLYSANLPLGYGSQCKQKFIYRQLVAIDEDGNTIKDSFKMPSCCQCVIFRSFGKWGRG